MALFELKSVGADRRDAPLLFVDMTNAESEDCNSVDYSTPNDCKRTGVLELTVSCTDVGAIDGR